MAQVDIYRSNILRKRNELVGLSSARAKESSKIPALNQKILSAKDAISRTKQLSTVKSKLGEIERAEKEIVRTNKNIADIEKKIAQKDKELANEEKRYRDEECREGKKRQETEKRRMQENERQMRLLDNTLQNQGRTQREMQTAIETLQSLPENITVLFMASNPLDMNSLRLDVEARLIQQEIRKSEYRDSVKFETRWAVRPGDLLQAINELNPDIIHFSGHGTLSDEIVLQNGDGTHRYVSKEALVQMMKPFCDRIRLVFFNTCFSAGQAETIVEHIDASIGMSADIGDEAARIFAAQFYSAIGFGCSLSKSFEQAKAALMLHNIPEEDIPELYTKDEISASDIFIVKAAQREFAYGT